MANRQSSTSSPYTGHSSPKSALTSERIAADIAAFNDAGGHIEVLGNTPFRHRPKEMEAPVKAKPGTAASPLSGIHK
jgi:hypothetical protein